MHYWSFHHIYEDFSPIPFLHSPNHYFCFTNSHNPFYNISCILFYKVLSSPLILFLKPIFFLLLIYTIFFTFKFFTFGPPSFTVFRKIKFIFSVSVLSTPSLNLRMTMLFLSPQPPHTLPYLLTKCYRTSSSLCTVLSLSFWLDFPWKLRFIFTCLNLPAFIVLVFLFTFQVLDYLKLKANIHITVLSYHQLNPHLILSYILYCVRYLLYFFSQNV